MFYLEDEKTLVLTSENKKDILSALKLINNIPTDNEAGTAYYAESFKEINQTVHTRTWVCIFIFRSYMQKQNKIKSAFFAALTSILAKIGINGVNSNLATAVRTVVVVGMSWLMVFVTNQQAGLSEISKKSWIFLILSGLATGASWLCYYRALQLGSVAEVAAIDKLSIVITVFLAVIFLQDTLTIKTLIGCGLITAGTVLMVW